MKKFSVICLMLVAAMALSCKDEGNKKKLLGLGLQGGGDASRDIINDIASEEDFNYQTTKNVGFDLKVVDADDNPINKVVILINAGSDGEVCNSVTGADGKAVFTASIKTTTASVTVTLENHYYLTRTIEISDIQKLASVVRTIYLEKKDPPPPPPPDADNDGVPDSQDEFPNDPALIGTVRGEYTIAFEDLYPEKGDADFNDLVVKLNIIEYLNPANKISKVEVKSKVLAAGAGYTNKLYIAIGASDYLLNSDPKADLNGGWNSNPGETYYNAQTRTKTVTYTTPKARSEMPAMPYDPYIKANGVEANQVHLPFVETRFAGTRLDTDKFPWAILVPATWGWPYEQNSIFNAYPQFKGWYESDGVQNKDWYLNPNSTYVFPVGTAVGAYIMKALPGAKSGILIGMIAGVLAIVVGINVWRRRKTR